MCLISREVGYGENAAHVIFLSESVLASRNAQMVSGLS